MTIAFNAVAHLLFIFSVATLFSSALCLLFVGRFLKLCKTFEACSRVRLLRIYAALPLMGGLGIGAMICLPAISHVSDMPLEHCHESTACLDVSALHMATMGELGVVVSTLFLLLWAAVIALTQWWRAKNLWLAGF